MWGCEPKQKKDMPNYDYQCQECGHTFEVFQKMSDAKLEHCPQEDCNGKVKRLLGTGAGLIFKGSGFYQTDYRSESYKKAASKDSAAGKKTDTANKGGGHSCGAGCGCGK